MDIMDIEKTVKGQWITPLTGKEVIDHTTIYIKDLKNENNLFIAMDHETWAVGSNNKGSIYDNWSDTHRSIIKHKDKISVLIVQKFIEELKDIPQFLTKNTYQALIDLSMFQRQRFSGKLIGITGTVGKSTTQNMIGTLLRKKYQVVTNDKNNNSKTGVRVGLSNLKDTTNFGVFEIAVSSLWFGELGIAEEVRPDVALITQIGTGQYGTSEEDTIRFKSRLVAKISKEGYIILNKDIKQFDLTLEALRQYSNQPVITYGINQEADIYLLKREKKEAGYLITIANRKNNETYQLMTRHDDDGFISNILATITTLYVLGENVFDFLEDFTIFCHQKSVLEEIHLPYGTLLVDDTHNAEELSVQNALTLSKDKMRTFTGKKIAVLARIFSLRDLSRQVHVGFAPYLIDAGFDTVITYGPEIDCLQKELPIHMRGGHFNTLEECSEMILTHLQDNSYIILKGDRRNSDFDQLRFLLERDASYYLEKENQLVAKLAFDPISVAEDKAYNQIGVGNLLIILECLEQLREKKIALTDKIICQKNPARSSNNDRAVGLTFQQAYILKDLLQWSVSLNAPDALLCLAEYLYGSNQEALKGLQKKSEGLHLSDQTVKNISGRVCGYPQKTYIADLQKIAQAFLKIEYEYLQLLRNQPMIVQGCYRECLSQADKMGYCFASLVYGKNQSEGIFFKYINQQLSASVVINAKDYWQLICASEDLYQPQSLHSTPVSLTHPIMNILGDSYFGEFYADKNKHLHGSHYLKELGYHHSSKNIGNMIGSKDYTIANFEATFTKQKVEWPVEKIKPFSLYANPEETIKELKKLGVNLVTLGNNHILDFDRDNMDYTIAKFNQADILTIGYEDNILTYQYKGEKVAIVNGYWYKPHYENIFDFYRIGEKTGVNCVNSYMINQIKWIKEKEEKTKVIAICHWGSDYVVTSQYQKKLANRIILAGADLIIGHGTHSIQPIEVVDHKLVIYGIGNFIFNNLGEFKKHDVLPYSYNIKLNLETNCLWIIPMYVDNRKTQWQPKFVSEEDIEKIVRFNEDSNILGRQNLCHTNDYFYFKLPIFMDNLDK